MDIISLARSRVIAKEYTDSVALSGVSIHYPEIDPVTSHWRIFDPVSGSYIDTGVSAKGIDTTKKYSETIFGDGIKTTFIINHNLGTKDVFIQVRDLETGERVIPDDKIKDDNTAEIIFGTPPAVSQNYRIVVI